MRVLPIGLAIIRGCGWLLIGIGFMVMVFASRQASPGPQTAPEPPLPLSGSSLSSELSLSDIGSALLASEKS